MKKIVTVLFMLLVWGQAVDVGTEAVVYVGESAVVITPYGIYMTWGFVWQLMIYLVVFLGTVLFGRSWWDRRGDCDGDDDDDDSCGGDGG